MLFHLFSMLFSSGLSWCLTFRGFCSPSYVGLVVLLSTASSLVYLEVVQLVSNVICASSISKSISASSTNVRRVEIHSKSLEHPGWRKKEFVSGNTISNYSTRQIFVPAPDKSLCLISLTFLVQPCCSYHKDLADLFTRNALRCLSKIGLTQKCLQYGL